MKCYRTTGNEPGTSFRRVTFLWKVFSCRSEERGKCFIEYIPAENAWVPIEADGWFYINYLWV
ncbi:MAG: hypothetical protein U0I77_09725 [Holdemanella sp.]|uniref:hypothetical protein n=1 Tax=Holdemanella sp. TaxID=1971762 RepID=UPI002E777279|nr:hypothetical protein [Holdemanella sp.]MEE0080355.1 hypothetical protein [Holdemanella sp.]